MIDIAHAEEERPRRLAAFLIERRSRIPREAFSLGPYPRLRQRHGLPVSPDEIARVIGVGADWYALLEKGVPTRPSPQLIDRLAQALALGAEDALTLWDLAIPALRTGPRDESRIVVETYASMQWYLRKLSAASSVEEVLSLAEQTAYAHFPETSFIIAMSRTPDGRWAPHGEGLGTTTAIRRVWRQYADIHRPIGNINRGALDQLMGFPTTSQPGDLLTFADFDRTALSTILKGAWRRYERNNGAELIARMRSRSGYVGHLFFADFCKSYEAPVDWELAATIADLASLALS
jgi:transcriptional regulator with XRE-family HTH domain